MRPKASPPRSPTPGNAFSLRPAKGATQFSDQFGKSDRSLSLINLLQVGSGKSAKDDAQGDRQDGQILFQRIIPPHQQPIHQQRSEQRTLTN